MESSAIEGLNLQASDYNGYNVWCRNMGFEKKGRGVTGEDRDENASVDSLGITDRVGVD